MDSQAGYVPGRQDAMVGLVVRRLLGPNHNTVNYHFMAGIAAMAAGAEARLKRPKADEVSAED